MDLGDGLRHELIDRDGRVLETLQSDWIRWSCQAGPGPFSKSSARVSVGPSATERAGPIPVRTSMPRTIPHTRITPAP